jgi:hypothetical protein
MPSGPVSFSDARSRPGQVAVAIHLDYDRTMSARAALVFGLFLVAAAVLHGGLYSAGNDFIVNRFTGAYEFVPADDYDDEDEARHVHTRFRTLTSRRPAGRVEGLQCRR